MFIRNVCFITIAEHILSLNLLKLVSKKKQELQKYTFNHQRCPTRQVLFDLYWKPFYEFNLYTCKQLIYSAEMRITLCIVELKFINSYATNVI